MSHYKMYANSQNPQQKAPILATAQQQPALMSNPDATDMLVVDPMSRKIRIPREALDNTKALSRPGIPSLCMLHLESTCRQGAMCHQVHAKADVVARLREDALQVPTCCKEHGDVNSDRIPEPLKTKPLRVKDVTIPPEKLAFTTALLSLQYEPSCDVIQIPSHLLCRLHGRKRCRYSDDCKFIHVCRHLLLEKLEEEVPVLLTQLEMKRQKKDHAPHHHQHHHASSRPVHSFEHQTNSKPTMVQQQQQPQPFILQPAPQPVLHQVQAFPVPTGPMSALPGQQQFVQVVQQTPQGPQVVLVPVQPLPAHHHHHHHHISVSGAPLIHRVSLGSSQGGASQLVNPAEISANSQRTSRDGGESTTSTWSSAHWPTLAQAEAAGHSNSNSGVEGDLLMGAGVL